jgi:glycosyltransferase involved in cell wall biosynthesis
MHLDKQNPFFSIIIPVYNRAYILSKAIESCLKQTFDDFELIIVDDCSTDNSVEVAKSFQDDRIVIIVNPENQERSITRNNGIKAACGKFICFLDSDDYFLENHLSEAYQKLEQENFAEKFYFVNAWNQDFDGTISERDCPNIKEYNPFHFFMTFTVNPPRWVVHHTIFNKILFDPVVTIAEDMDFTLRAIALNIPIVQLQVRTVVYVASLDNFVHSDPKRGEKYLFFFDKIFKKTELKPFLPQKTVNELLAMSHYMAAVYQFNQGNRKLFTTHALKSLRLDPKGYNKNSTKDLLVLLTKTLLRMK